MQYPIAILKSHQVFNVTIPDIPTLTVQGNDMADAVSKARLAVLEHLHHLVATEQPLPKPSAVGSHLSNLEYAGYVWAIVNIELSRIIGDDAELTVRLPARLMTQIRHKLPQREINDVIVQALTHYLASPP